ncbi:MAG TPA: cytochrome P450 [Candidatus Sulfotelmatobacter sp.]|nr:cytochrome P450 [Candidatus Sulfotelmatobacter sp.]
MGRQFDLFGDIYKTSIYGTDAYVVRNVESAYHVLVENWQNYVKGQIIERVGLLLGNGLMVSEGATWKRQRRMIQPTFNPGSVATVIQMVKAVNLRLLEKWQLAASSNESVNITKDVSSMALEIILRFIFGEEYEHVAGDFDLLAQEKARDMAFARSFRGLRKVILQLIEMRRRRIATPTDALAALMLARDPRTGQSMEDRQLVDEILTLVVAGHETTASTLNFAWYLLTQHSPVEERLSDELSQIACSELDDQSNSIYAMQIIDETMRLYPAGWLLTRKALRDDWLGDYFVPAGTEIYVSPYFIQRNPSLWEEPDRFDPDRFRPDVVKQRHRLATIPFSTGPRNCIGVHFAKMEMQVHLIMIARRLRFSYVPVRPIELEAGVNLRSSCDFIMKPSGKVDDHRFAASG